MPIDDEVLKKLVAADDDEEFVCPDCRGSFFRRVDLNPLGGTMAAGAPEMYECKTGTADSYLTCGWKGPRSECFLPSRSALATEILALRFRFPHEPVVPAEDENPFVVDGGRYSENRRLGICDLCDRVDVPCVTVPAAEDQSSTGACEACVLRMLRAFVRDRATHIQLAVPDVAAVDAAGGRFIPNVRSEEDPKEGR